MNEFTSFVCPACSSTKLMTYKYEFEKEGKIMWQIKSLVCVGVLLLGLTLCGICQAAAATIDDLKLDLD